MDYLVCAACLRSKDEAEQGFGVVFALPAPAVVNCCGYVELYGDAGSGTWAQKSPYGIGDRRDGCADGTAGWRDCRQRDWVTPLTIAKEKLAKLAGWR
jgi:hypothetical protein